MSIKEEITKIFEQKFTSSPEVVAQAPGRVNLIGEHTDYNGGYVLPLAINQCAVVAVAKRNDQHISLYSTLFDERFEIALNKLCPQPQPVWVNYILGVINQLQEKGKPFTGLNVVVSGNVPLGAGLSSSASVECAIAVALNELFKLQLTRMQLAKTAQKAEQKYAGVNCGIMDHFASVYGKEGHAVRLDCNDLSYAYFPLNLGEYTLLLLNTNVKHSLASSAYNERRKACERVVAIVAEKYPEVSSLRDVSEAMLEELVRINFSEEYTKALYVVAEIKRVEKASEALVSGDLVELGRLMYATHDGLQQHYKVSCAELDFLVDYVGKIPEVLGARMMGGGFGGCTLNLVRKDYVEELVANITPLYKEQFNLALSPIQVKPSSGACIL